MGTQNCLFVYIFMGEPQVHKIGFIIILGGGDYTSVTTFIFFFRHLI